MDRINQLMNILWDGNHNDILIAYQIEIAEMHENENLPDDEFASRYLPLLEEMNANS